MPYWLEILIDKRNRMYFCRRWNSVIGKTLLVMTFASFLQFSSAQEYVWAPVFPVGSLFIEISAQDQNGVFRSFNGLVGEKGLLFMLSRSFDW